VKENKIKRRHGFYDHQAIDTSMPVLILGGKENALSLTRSLGRVGIRVGVSGPPDCWGIYSSHCSERYYFSRNTDPKAYWRKLLLGPNPIIKERQILLPCSDNAIEFLAENEAELRKNFVFDGGQAGQRLDLLDKRRTLEIAKTAGISTPKSWPVSQGEDFAEKIADMQFPLIVKPHNTFNFARVFGRKFFQVQSGLDELREKVREAHESGFEVSIVELIPGPDNLLSSYYTYIDDDGTCLFHFTKRVFRRYPMNCGGATYHATEWLPETAAEGLKFFKNTRFRGLGNIEFKRDLRDNKLKIIEVNARFTAAQELAVRAGMPIDLIVYCQLTGQANPTVSSFETDLRYWYPVKDFLAFLELRRLGQLSFFDWIRSFNPKRNVSPLFDLGDLKPAFGAAGALVGKAVRRFA
jgi:D-aspartate ligase